MSFKLKTFLSLLLLFLCIPHVLADKRQNLAYKRYIEKYAYLAVEHDRKYNIPASIKLAQALLESGAGLSPLASKSNNHFGIKCHSTWTGDRTYHDDDRANECFRKYKQVAESYEDHSRFLTSYARYKPLFKLDKGDYRRWAKGLKSAGYATDRGYANKLIKVIDTYELYLYDVGGKSGRKASKPSSKPFSKSTRAESLDPLTRDIFKTHGLIYIIAGPNDSFERIGADLDFKPKKLARYNELPIDFPLQQGDIVYLEKKKSRADKPYYNHKVQAGESMHSIAQQYGIRIDKLYLMNEKDPNYIPEVGDMLKLR